MTQEVPENKQAKMKPGNKLFNIYQIHEIHEILPFVFNQNSMLTI